MDKTIGVGIVGYGMVGAYSHREWVKERDDARLTAVCDTAEARRSAAKKDNPDIQVYGDYRQFLEDPDLDLVIVTTPPSTHYELCLMACRAGKHVFVDKPFALNLSQAEEMLDAAKQADVVIHCHQSRRYDPEYRSILSTVQDGTIGEILHVRRIWSQYGDVWASYGIEGFNPTWRILKEFGGGMVYDYVPHCGDQILRLIDKPLKQVYSDVRSLKFSTEVDDHFSCLMRFEGGATAYLEASNLSPLPSPHWYVIGSEGCITAESVGSSIQVLKYGDEEPEIRPPLARQHELYDNLVAACRGEATPNVTPDQLRSSMKLIDAVFASAVERAAVNVF